MPLSRRDTHDRIVADTDREMARITAEVEERLARLASEFDGVPVEGVVRFGPLGAELSIEVEVFGADLVALVCSASTGVPPPLSRVVSRAGVSRVEGAARSPAAAI